MCYCTSVFANEQEAVSSFTALVNKIQTEIEKTYTDDYARLCHHETLMSGKKVIRPGFWSKYRHGDLGVSYDIQKTDSLISPYKGIISITYYNLEYFDTNNPEGKFKTEAAAANATLKRRNNIYPDQWEWVYSYQNNQWIIKKERSNLGDQMWRDVKMSDPASLPIMVCRNLK